MYLSHSGETLLQGSVIYQADFLAFNANQSSLIYDSFTEFVSNTKTLEIGGKTYRVECIDDCVGGPGDSEGRSGKIVH